ncbi:pyridoxal kinase [Minwuia sp.]|uniref:pyridoxal kinase n=1 Tax=Minwuia sp. TaxID=2493630 RepID=UPI003A945CB9
MVILSISSQVAMGHVGNAATAYALRRLGHEVWDVPTIILSHHPGHGKPAALRTPPDTVRQMIASLRSRAEPDAVFSGYLADAENADIVAETVADLGATVPFILDPVLGDSHTGLYVAPEIADAVASRLVPLASVMLPNRFELAHLSGRNVDLIGDCREAALSLVEKGPKAVICTSSPADTGMVAAQLVTRDGCWRVQMPLIPEAPHGTGDLFAGVFMARWLDGAPMQEAMGYAAGAVHAVVGWSQAMRSGDLALVAGQAALNEPPVLPEIEKL